MKQRPEWLSYKQLRRVVGQGLGEDWNIIESDHAEKHPTLTIVNVILALKEEWRGLQHKWDRKRKCWKYIVLTTGLNDRRLTLVFTADEEKKEIRVITRFQDEYAERYRAKPRLPIAKKKSRG
jgi:hypothetical protein